MTSDPKSFSTLKKLAARQPGSAELFTTLWGLLYEPNDRANALTIGAVLEGALKLAIIPKIIIPEKEGEIDLFGHQAPLRAFSAKIKMGFALGIFGAQTRVDLDAIREVRNAFAHSMTPIEYGTKQVASVCARITLPERANLNTDLPTDWVDARARYVLSASWLAILFDSMGESPTWAEPIENENPQAIALFDGAIRAIAE